MEWEKSNQNKEECSVKLNRQQLVSKTKWRTPNYIHTLTVHRKKWNHIIINYYIIKLKEYNTTSCLLLCMRECMCACIITGSLLYDIGLSRSLSRLDFFSLFFCPIVFDFFLLARISCKSTKNGIVIWIEEEKREWKSKRKKRQLFKAKSS